MYKRQALISAKEEQPGPLDMGELCNGTDVLFRALAIAQGIDLVLEIPKELVYVFADENQLRRLLINLVANAAQVLRGYREDGRIKVSLKNADEGLVLMVQDNGPGMDAQTLERIFDRFYTCLLYTSVEHVPAYRQYKELVPQIVTDPFTALTNFPVLTKDAFRMDPESFIADDADRSTLIANNSGGSSGHPVQFYMNRHTVCLLYTSIIVIVSQAGDLLHHLLGDDDRSLALSLPGIIADCQAVGIGSYHSDIIAI